MDAAQPVGQLVPFTSAFFVFPSEHMPKSQLLPDASTIEVTLSGQHPKVDAAQPVGQFVPLASVFFVLPSEHMP